MKKMIIILLSLIIGYALYWGISNNDYKMDKKRSIVGEYKLDIYRTELSTYKDSIDKYKHLILTFNRDMTFSLNFPVPFMAASHGIWEVGGMDEWCKLFILIILLTNSGFLIMITEILYHISILRPHITLKEIYLRYIKFSL